MRLRWRAMPHGRLRLRLKFRDIFIDGTINMLPAVRLGARALRWPSQHG